MTTVALVTAVGAASCRRGGTPTPTAADATSVATATATVEATPRERPPRSSPSRIVNTSTGARRLSGRPADHAAWDTNAAQKFYAGVENDSMATAGVDVWHTMAGGALSFRVTRDSTGPVTGTFGRYHGHLKIDATGPRTATLFVDINSLDTRIPDRDRNTLRVFFGSAIPERAVARLTLDDFDLGDARWDEVIADDRAVIGATGRLAVGSATVSVSGTFGVNAAADSLSVHTVDPLRVSISALGLEGRARDLMTLCDVAWLQTLVDLHAQLSLQKSEISGR